MTPEPSSPPRCVRCLTTSERLIESYWGDVVCASCAPRVALLLDERDAWPPVPAGLIPDAPAGTGGDDRVA
jgi:hypothetical protein